MKLGCFLLRPGSAGEALRRFRLAEEAGFDAAFATHVNGADAPTLLAAAAAATERIELGAGVVPIYTRTPATMAQTAATLWQLSDGRLRLGLGLGHRAVVEQWHGATIAKPLAEMREYVAIMRAALDGTAPPAAGRWAAGMPLGEVEAAGMPLLIGALSPGMLRLAGEIAQGVVLWMATPRQVAETVVPCLREGRERAGLPLAGFEIVASVPTAVGDDPAPLRRAYVRQIAHNLRLPFYRAVLERGGYVEELAAIAAAERYENLFEPLPEPVLETIAGGRFVADAGAIGGPAEVAAKLAEYERAGVTTIGVNPVLIREFEATLAAVAAAVP